MQHSQSASTCPVQTSCPVQPAPGACPRSDAPAAALSVESHGIEPSDELTLPLHKRVTAAYERTLEGQLEYRIYYGIKEISFDEPELFAFGEALAAQTRFAARDAMSWGNGYTWETVQPLLEELLAQEVLARGGAAQPERREGVVPAPLPAPPPRPARTWLDCEALTQAYSGRAVELGYLELIVPVYRILHPMLDREGRQVGEANVFPATMRVHVPTEWRACQYPGSRYQHENPMNVSALRTMIKHWKPMLTLLHCIRAEYLERFPSARGGALSLAHVERLSTLVLVLPTYLAMRQSPALPNGELHSALSSLFRITDGLRLTVHQMLLEARDERGLRDLDAPASCDEIFKYADRTGAFTSAHGVCAGPRHMIDELIAVVVEGKQVAMPAPEALEPELRGALALLRPAFDYGLCALQSFGVTLSFWATLTLAYQRLLACLPAETSQASPAAHALRSVLAERVRQLEGSTSLAHEKYRTAHLRFYGETHRAAACALGDTGAPTLAQRLAPSAMARDELAREELRRLLGQHLAPDVAHVPEWITAFTDLLVDYFRSERAVLAAGTELQGAVNQRLGRQPPTRSLTAADLGTYPWLFEPPWPFPSMAKDLEAQLNVRVEVSLEALRVSVAHID